MWAWFDASQGVTGTSLVTDWADQSGNGNNLSYNSYEPELAAAIINGLPVVRKKASQDAWMRTAGNLPDSLTGMTIFIVASQAATDSTNGVFIASGTGINVGIYRSSSTKISGKMRNSGAVICSPVIADDTFYTIRLKYDGTTQGIAINNGTEVTNNPTVGSDTPSRLNVFAHSAGDVGNKQIAEIIIYEDELDAAEILQNETYLKNKYAHY